MDGYIEKKCVYFKQAGVRNTDMTVTLAAERTKELGIKHVVVASDTGLTGAKMAEALKGQDVKLVVVGAAVGKNLERLEKSGIPFSVIRGTHPLSSVERSLRREFGGINPMEIIAVTLKRVFCQGMKVVVEIACMASDHREVPVTADVIAVGGTARGADTAVVIKPFTYGNMFNQDRGVKIKEIICMPRERSPIEKGTTLA